MLTDEEAECLIDELKPCAPQDARCIDNVPSAIVLHEQLIARGYLITEHRTWETIDSYGRDWDHSAVFYVVTSLGRAALECYFAAKAPERSLVR